MTACHGDNLARGRGDVHSRGCWSRCWSLVTTAADRAELEHPPIAFSTRILAVANRRAVTHPCLLTALSRHVLDDSHSLPPRFISDRICFSPLHLGLVLVSAHPMPATIDKTRHCDQ
ncbi:hypothetical protein J3E72DRAFT_270895 [Bipolaris maydis]|nr:hypothetical protein J3E72DRAFT_270895 [Bipolaris maydis]